MIILGITLFFNMSLAQETPLVWPDPNEEVPSYTLEPREGSMNVFHTPNDDVKLGKVKKAEVYETENHLYRVPFNYQNVKVDGWTEFHDKGIEVRPTGSITIVEKKPIVSVTIVGSGCSAPNYNTVEWWGESESLANHHGSLIRRSRIDNLEGQHSAWLQKALVKPDRFNEKGITTIEEATALLNEMQRVIYAMTNNYYVPGSIMGGLYENTAYFRIGDVNIFNDDENKKRKEVFREVVDQQDVHKIVIRGGGLDYEDPGSDRERYPADYCFRLIDVGVKK